MKNSYIKGVVILNYNTEEDTVKCVNSIFANTEDIRNTNIYIVDNCSPDESGVRLKERYKDHDGISVIISDRNGGFSYGNNFGIRQAMADGCKYVFLLNSDIYLLNDAIGLMAGILDENSEIYAVGPKIYDTEGNDTQFARKALTYKSHILERLPFIGDKHVRRYRYDKSDDYQFVGMSSGSCFGLRAGFFKNSDLLDDHVFMYYEEDILAYQLIRCGKKSVICSKARVVHSEGSSTKHSIARKAVFEKMHRWTSALYVLKRYACISDAQAKFLYRINKLEWKVLTLLNAEYREKYEDFVCCMDGALR